MIIEKLRYSLLTRVQFYDMRVTIYEIIVITGAIDFESIIHENALK